MEEISDLHTKSLEWGCVTNLIDKIGDIEDKIEGHWDELVNMIADAISEESDNQDPTTLFFTLYQYMFRLYYRLRANPVKRQFNSLSKTKDGFRLTNYDYRTFKWAVSGGFIMTISNDFIDLPMEKLTTTQVRAFEHRLEKGAK